MVYFRIFCTSRYSKSIYPGMETMGMNQCTEFTSPDEIPKKSEFAFDGLN